MKPHPEIAAKVAATRLIDTHEHLLEESRRLKPPRKEDWLYPCNDWSYLLLHYAGDDLTSAGMSRKDSERFWSPDVEPAEKWRLLEPLWPKVRHTGYVQAARRTMADLFGEPELNAASCERVTERMRAAVKPGFYRTLLRDRCGIDQCHVNSLEHEFCETEQPDLLLQDLSINALGTDFQVDGYDVPGRPGRKAATLSEWYEVIDHRFELYGHKAVAVKTQAAYGRRLDFRRVSQEQAEPLFAALARDPKSVSEGDRQLLADHLFRRCVERATDYGLPVKTHTGYYAGANGMPLDRVGRNAADLCPLLQDFPNTRFVLFHMGYPYQHEMVALAKQYTNVTVDLCWAWIVSPIATVRFLEEFLLAAPANKLLCFGGDYYPVECVYGHSQIARQGLTQALGSLVDQGWLTLAEALDLVEPLCRGNALSLFPRRG
ncbi:MAG TPA: amidohydrolase family protein [Armatimonadota bacterium]|jgi:predicted TIM-barrel fold metal-dependent hydrolase